VGTAIHAKKQEKMTSNGMLPLPFAASLNCSNYQGILDQV